MNQSTANSGIAYSHCSAYWSRPLAEILETLGVTERGLTCQEARTRLSPARILSWQGTRLRQTVRLLLAQFKSPIILLLIISAVLSISLRDPTDAILILAIILTSALLGFWQERGAVRAVEALLATVTTRATVLRDNTPQEVAIDKVVPGDVVLLTAGDSLPGDGLLLDARDLFVDEAALTGESFATEKKVGVVPETTPLARRSNVLFLGTHVVSGTGRAVVVHTGTNTEFGKISERLRLRPPETEFERGVRRFGYLLLEVTLLLVITIFAVNVYLHRPVIESFLFSLALAVGLTPQLLPAIISVNLAHGARRMADKKVIVKRLAAIENFGSMNVLCSDKTGTLTTGTVQVCHALDVDGNESEKVLFHAYLNAYFETGFRNPIDEAIRAHQAFDLAGYRKVDEVPYDFLRKRLSILVERGAQRLAITKGALRNVLAVCATAEKANGAIVDLAEVSEQLLKRYQEASRNGFRVLGIACRAVAADHLNKEDEAKMVFLGFLILGDTPKENVGEAIERLRRQGVSLKLVTGDNRLVAAHVSEAVGLDGQRILTGQDLRQMTDAALAHQAGRIDVFAEVEPNQKEWIVRALRKAGNVVGYLGDGINDASALHAADVGISVDSAVDVAKETADIVLLDKDLTVLEEGVREGRRTFANTLKYVFMATSANFGNMFSMAGASLLLPFLPLLPKQILLTNLLTDLPEMAIATDRVDTQLIEKPRRWDIRFIRNFMLVFGLLSSVFDYVTFAVLWFLLRAHPEQFRTGWFIESVTSATLIVLVIRTRQPFFRSLPSRPLVLATLLSIGLALLLPISGLGKLFELTAIPVSFLGLMGVTVVFYVLAAEMLKRRFSL